MYSVKDKLVDEELLEDEAAREKSSNTEFFWTLFSCIRTEYGELRRKLHWIMTKNQHT